MSKFEEKLSFWITDRRNKLTASPCLFLSRNEGGVNLSKLELIYNPTKADGRKRLVTRARESVKETFSNMDLEKSYPALFEVLWYSQLPCFDVKDVTSKERDQYGLSVCPEDDDDSVEYTYYILFSGRIKSHSFQV